MRGSRRAALRHGLVVAGAAVAAGAIAPLARAPRAGAQEAGETATLERLIGLEQRAALAYRRLARGDLLEPEVRRAAELFASQEDEHADALTAALEDRGGTRPKPARAAEIGDLGELDSEADALRAARDLEDELVLAYQEAAETFEAFELLKTCAQIVACEGQHLAVLREQLGRDPVPEAFELGELDE